MYQTNSGKPKGMFPMPAMIAEAMDQSHSRPLVIEVIIFVVVFFVGTFVESLIAGLGMVPILFADPRFMAITGGGVPDPALINDLVSSISGQPIMTAVMLFATIGLTGVALLYCRVIERRRMPSLGFRKPGFATEYLIGLVVGALMFSLAVAISALTGTLRFEGFSAAIPWSMLGLFLLGYVLQGMSEEVLCRGYLLVSVARRQAIPVAIIINSVAFSALHGMNPNISVLALVNLVLFGVFVSVYFVKRGDIWGIAAIHTAWNFVQGNVFGISVSGMQASATTVMSFVPTADGSLISGGAFGLEGGLAATIVLVLFTVGVYFLPSRNTAALVDNTGAAPAAPTGQAVQVPDAGPAAPAVPTPDAGPAAPAVPVPDAGPAAPAAPAALAEPVEPVEPAAPAEPQGQPQTPFQAAQPPMPPDPADRQS